MPLSGAESAHLCRRVGFGGTKAEINYFAGREREDAVAEILGTNPTSPTAPGFIDQDQWWRALNDMRFWWVDRMIDARWTNRTDDRPSPLEEKLTLFWHGHFASGISKVEDSSVMWYQNNIFRNHGRGSFGTLLERVCTNGALLSYLDNNTNVADNPQENFARELMELYTIGPEHFEEADVVAMTRAWTGHGIIGWTGDHIDATYRFRSRYHDKGQKVLFGLAPKKWNGPDTLSIFSSGVRRDQTARFIAAKLWRFFVNDEPTSAELDAVVDAFLPTLNITDALRAILLHPTFWATETEFALSRSPIEIIVQVLRQLKVNAEDGAFTWQLGTLGHAIFEPPSVAGWGTGDFWLGTGSTWAKAQWAISLGWNRDVWGQFQSFVNKNTGAKAANLVVDLLGIPSVSGETRSALEGLWLAHQERDSWVAKHHSMVLGILSPEMQVA